MKTIGGIKDLERAGHWENLSRVLCPRRILPPQGYPNTKHFAWGIHSQLVNKCEERNNSPKDQQVQWESEVWIRSAIEFINRDAPVFFLDESLCQMLENTSPPLDIHPSEIEMPYPSFGLILPETRKQPLLLVAEINDNQLPILREDKARLLESIPATLNSKKRNLKEVYFANHTKPETETHLAVLRGRTSGEWGGSWCKIFDATLGDILKNHEERLIETYAPLNLQDVDSIHTTNLALNLLCYLKYHYVPESKITLQEEWKKEKAETKKTLEKRGFKKAIVIREPLLKQNQKDDDAIFRPKINRSGPSTHWRRGHWHTILHGERKSLRARRWYKPILVNPT